MDLGGHSPPPGRSSDKSPPPRPSHDKRQSSTSAVRSTGPRQTSARPILSKAARNLPSTIEIAVAEASRVKKATQKTAEKVRRDRLKGAVEELIKSTSEPCCSDSAVEPGAETSSSAATKIQGVQTTSSKAGNVEFSVHYITCLKSQLRTLQHQLEICEAGQKAEGCN